MKIIKYEDFLSSVSDKSCDNENKQNESDSSDDSDIEPEIHKNLSLPGRPKSGRIWKQPKQR